MLATLGKNYFVKDTDSFCEMADALEGIEGFDLKTQYHFSLCPLKMSFKSRKTDKKLR